MSSSRPSGGRQKKTVSGGGNVNKRGSGLGSGPVGGGGRPGGGAGGGAGGAKGSGGGTRGTGGSLLTLLLGLILGKTASSGGTTSKSGCLKRILILAVVVIAVVFLVRLCSSGGTVSDLLGGLLGDDGSSSDIGSGSTGGGSSLDNATGQTSGADLISTFIGNNSTFLASAESDVYRAHTPDYNVATAARDKYTKLKGNGQDIVTIMVFLCGTDLETRNGMGTSDLQEMMNANISDKVNIIVETGGTSAWKNSTISNRTNQIYQIKSGGLVRLEDSLGKNSMVDPSTLSGFIQYCKRNFPADRYGLIFWDHGGGSLTGYGYDELYKNAGSMTLDKIDQALKNGGCQFDFIGFDACLMATLETAFVAEQYADYLIASEATEPGTGWYYTNWLTALSADTSMPTVDLAKIIIDDFIATSATSGSPTTLSLIDLAELSGTVPAPLTAFSNDTSTMLDSDYAAVSNARSGAKDFSSSSKINQIDLIHFLDNLNTDSANALANALRGCVKYNRSGMSVTNANGVTIYFPYQSLGKVSTALSTYNKIGMNKSYTNCIKSFASMAAGGQVTSGSSQNAMGSLLGDSSGSLLGSLLGGSSSGSSSSSGDIVSTLLEAFLSGDRSLVTGDADSSWVEEDRLRASLDYYSETRVGLDALTLTEVDGRQVLSLSEEQWAAIQTLEMNLFVDDGEGYIDLGFDPYAQYDDAGNLIMEFDGTWLSVNGQNVAAYFISEDRVDDDYTLLYRVPALLNGERVNVILAITGNYADDADEECLLLGAQADYEETSDAVMKGLLPIAAGDTLQFLCDYYSYAGEYLDSYMLGEELTATGEWEVGYASVGDVSWSMCYRLTDIYSGRYWTPVVTN